MLYNKETQTQNAEPEEPGKLLLINVSHTQYTCNLSKIYTWPHQLLNLMKPMNRVSDISRSRRPAKFRYFREIPRNSQKNTKYREIRQKYFQIHVGKTYLILILAIRPVLFTPNVQIYLETSSLQRVNNVSKLPGVLR